MWQLFRWSSQFYLIEYLHAKSSRVLVPTLHIHYILLSAVPKQGQSRDWSIKWRPGPSPLPDYRISAFKIQPATTGLQTFSISQPPLMTRTRLPWPYITLSCEWVAPWNQSLHGSGVGPPYWSHQACLRAMTRRVACRSGYCSVTNAAASSEKMMGDEHFGQATKEADPSCSIG
jgi:hypothetical protein